MNKCERGQSQNEKPLKLEDLHSALQVIFDIPEAMVLLNSTIKREGEEKTALNLREEIIRNRITFEEEYEWRVDFGFEKDREFDKFSISLVLSNVESEEKGIKELETIAKDLQKIYRLPYKPEIFCNREPVELPKK